MFGPYKCNCCGEVFDEPQAVPEFHGFKDFPEIFYVCPYCGGDYEDYDEEAED